MKNFRNLLKTIMLVFTGLLFIGTLSAQDKPPPGELSDEEKAQANNPLANFKGLNMQVYFRPQLSEVENGAAHQEVARFVYPTGRILWRLSVPFEQRHINNSTVNFSESGLGDIDLFGAYLAVMKPKLTFGIGPAIAFNTASDASLGTGRNSLGAAAVVFAVPNPALQVGGLVLWRTDIGGDDSREKAHILALQPFYIFQAGKGLYFGGAPIIPINLTNGDYHIPLGMRIGKVIKIENTVLNFFLEPQPSLIVSGVGQPQFQIYGALNMQFK
ncbi:MAG: hypothetical protein ACR2MM_01765 [Flavobacteriaceae bacterium]